MDKNSLQAIQTAAADLPSAKLTVLSGAILTARHCYDALALAKGAPLLAEQIADHASQHDKKISPENVRQVLRALRAGGLPIASSRRGFWLKP